MKKLFKDLYTRMKMFFSRDFWKEFLDYFDDKKMAKRIDEWAKKKWWYSEDNSMFYISNSSRYDIIKLFLSTKKI